MSNTQAINTNTKRTKREVPKDLPSLSVFQYPYSWKTWCGFWYNLAYFFRCWRPAWHRATKGFCRADTWNVDTTTCAYLVNVLTEYRNVTRGWPDQCFATFEDWIAYIDEIIDHLIYALEDEDKLNKYYDSWFSLKTNVDRCDYTPEQEQLCRDYISEVEEVYNRQKEARIKAFTMLGAYINHIWW